MTAQRYRKIPNVIEAMQFSEVADGPEILAWIFENDPDSDAEQFGDVLKIPTLEGVMDAPLGWWIIKGIQGEFYPCAHEIFEDSYLPVGPELVKKEMTIDWPRLVDGDPVTQEMLKKAWGEFMTPLQEAGRGGEINVKVLLTVFRNVYGGMQS